MDSVSGCKLPLSLKVKISKLIDKYCFNNGLSINMDVTSLGNVSNEFQDMFARLMKHVCNVDSRTKDLVLDLMKAIAETAPSAGDDNSLSRDLGPLNDSSHVADLNTKEVNHCTHVVEDNKVASGWSSSFIYSLIFFSIFLECKF